MQPMPRAVYVAFLLCLLIGALVLSSAIESLLRFGASRGDGFGQLLWALAAFDVAYGLRRGSRIARKVVYVCASLVLVPSIALLPWVLFAWEGFVVKLPGAALAAVSIGLAIYFLRGMHSPAADQWFDSDRRKQEPVRFGIRSLLLVTAVLAITFANVRWSDVSYGSLRIASQWTGTPAGRSIGWHFGIREHTTNPSLQKVEFVVIETDEPGENSGAFGYSSRGSLFSGKEITLRLANGISVEVLGEARLIEVHGERTLMSKERVTWPQLDGYMHSNPETPTIDGLLAFEPELDDK